MASTLVLADDTGAAAGSPAKGTTRVNPTTQWNWLAATDVTTAPASAFIVIGTNSYERFRFGVIGGTFTELSNGLWSHTAGTFGSNITLVGVVTSTYSTPSQTTNAALTEDMTTPAAIALGQAVLFSTTGPEGAAPAATLAAAGYTQYLVSQMLTAAGAATGATTTATCTVQFDET